jgi:hypothetical protein
MQHCVFAWICLLLDCQVKSKQLNIHQILSVILLWVFSIALTPWGAFHNHHEVPEAKCSATGNVCNHKYHVSLEKHNCLVCAVHFEKDYAVTAQPFVVWLKSIAIFKSDALSAASYVELISTSLRGPPTGLV